MELETVESNSIRDISKRKTIKKIRELLSDGERVKIDKYLRSNFYAFWRFANIFSHSGARKNEMLNGSLGISMLAGALKFKEQVFEIKSVTIAR